MPVLSAHSSLNSLSSFPEHAAKPVLSDGATSTQLLFYTLSVLTSAVPLESLPTVLTSPVTCVSPTRLCESLRSEMGPGS